MSTEETPKKIDNINIAIINMQSNMKKDITTIDKQNDSNRKK
jgi:hypothetical protein